MSPELDARIDAIVARLDPAAREHARRDIERIADLGVETVTDVQARCIDRTAPADTRAIACWLLGRLGGEAGTLEALVTALSAPEIEVQAEAAKALGDLDDPRAVGPLVATLSGDGDARAVRATAAWALGMIGDHLAFTALVARLSPSEPEPVRQACAEALGDLGHPAAGPVLTAALDDHSPSVRHVAAHALCGNRDPHALPRLREIAARDNGIAPRLGRVREAAAQAILAIEGPMSAQR